jgi:hypothetical protein
MHTVLSALAVTRRMPSLRPLALTLAFGLLFIAWTTLYLALSPILAILRHLNRTCLRPTYADATAPGPTLWLTLGLAELPLCVLSYLANRAVLQFLKDTDKSIELSTTRWQDRFHERLGGETFDYKYYFGALLFGPRWNTHTNVHELAVCPSGRISVVRVENIVEQGFSWQVVAYGNALGRETLGRCGPVSDASDTVTLRVETREPYGWEFSLRLRGYLFDDRVSAPLPRVWLDGVLLTKKSKLVRADQMDFNRILRAHQQLVHLALQFYVFPLLCFCRFFSEAFVRAEYLPVPNPDTQWLYGPVLKGYALRFRITATVLADHLVFCTVYSRGSMPVDRLHDMRDGDEIEPADEDGFWALRCVRKDGGPTSPDVLPDIKVSLHRRERKKDTPRWALSNVATAKKCD